ncbi:MAG: trehalose-phosphatase [Halanaerobiales bacterium]
MIQYLLSNSCLKEIKNVISNKSLFLFLDYDGTLAPFKESPGRAVPLSGVKSVLNDLIQIDDIFISIISGRTLDSLNDLIDIPNINYIGTHGLEIKISNKYNNSSTPSIIYPDVELYNTGSDSGDSLSSISNMDKNTRNQVQESIQRVLEKTRSYFKYLKNKHTGIKYEDKKYILTLHYPSSFEVNTVVNYLQSLTAEKEVEILKGRKVIEIRPRGWHKGKAVKYIIEEILYPYLRENSDPGNEINKEDYLTIYIGDDTTDEDAFREIDGISIYVKNEGNLKTEADFYLNNPGDVLECLTLIKKIKENNKNN